MKHPLDMTPEERRGRYTVEFNGRVSGLVPLPRRAKDPRDLEVDEIVMNGGAAMAREVVPPEVLLLWSRQGRAS